MPTTIPIGYLAALAFVLGGYAFNFWMASRIWRKRAQRYQGLWLESIAAKPRRRKQLRVEPAAIRAVR